MLDKMPWVDVQKCNVKDICDDCKAARFCKNGSFQVVSDENGCRIGIDYERCKRCGECSHACELGAVKMI
jgi:Pyruvate/2-oxoacid:ferredoxin oxidoreductase delta subunit